MVAIAERLAEMLSTREDVELAVLFGSAATGELQPRSDVDVAVRWAGGDPADRDALLAAMERVIGRRIDLVAFDAAPPQLRFEIARNGIVLVERRQGAWSRARARAFLDWWDFRPIARTIHRAALARLGKR